ncbi:MAG: D-alanyl-D-alanine carboxypeptidase/D-alanyl-D-alanine-endopeptidase [Hydrogenophilaceae bacterium]|nr:D-alanyl-D-alanine carboxypeptidase/D-alanyl-D-alanine-endopeptidase [Hydrogenophilaceae bacterium]
MKAPFFSTGRPLAIILLLPALTLAQALPQQVIQSLKAAGIPENRFGAVVWEAGAAEPVLAHQAQSAFNPASVMKLLTTYAGLELLGPAYSWKTEIYTDGPIEKGRLAGNLYLKGYGDPALTLERVWLLVRDVRQRGVNSIDGDIVADASWFSLPDIDPARFDGEPRRTYNTPPSALMANFNAATVHVSADASQVKLAADPLPAGYSLVNLMKLTGGNCNEELRPNFDLMPGNGFQHLVVSGNFSQACAEKRYVINLGEPALTAAGMFLGLWKESGGSVAGGVAQSVLPANATLLGWKESPPLVSIVRDINKWSNNVMTRQLLLTLGAEKLGAPGTQEKGERVLREWLLKKGLKFHELVIDNGAGLSRIERISPMSMARLLQAAYRGPLFAKLESSLPIVAIDGTMKTRAKGNGVAGNAHLKTGTLNGVKSLAGYVLDNQGRRWIVVSFINHANAELGGTAQDALIEWVYQGMPK